MAETMVIQGRSITATEIVLIRGMLDKHREWGRTRLSEELCRHWNWRNAQGRIKDMAARTLLLKLERRGLIELPSRQRPSSNEFRNRRVSVVEHASVPIRGSLVDLRPLSVSVVAPGSTDGLLFNSLLTHHHYLGHRNTVGENLRYLVRDPNSAQILATLRSMARFLAKNGAHDPQNPHQDTTPGLHRFCNANRNKAIGWLISARTPF